MRVHWLTNIDKDDNTDKFYCIVFLDPFRPRSAIVGYGRNGKFGTWVTMGNEQAQKKLASKMGRGYAPNMSPDPKFERGCDWKLIRAALVLATEDKTYSLGDFNYKKHTSGGSYDLQIDTKEAHGRDNEEFRQYEKYIRKGKWTEDFRFLGSYTDLDYGSPWPPVNPTNWSASEDEPYHDDGLEDPRDPPAAKRPLTMQEKVKKLGAKTWF